MLASPSRGHLRVAVGWYLIHTKPGRENLAEFNLLRQKYQVYYPRLARTWQRRGRRISEVTSLFPRYLFLNLAQDQELGPVRSTLGVANIVRFGQAYAVVPASVIEVLRDRADPQTGFHSLQCHAVFEPGSEVKIIDGALQGLAGVFLREAGEQRVVLLLQLLGRDVHVEVAEGSILPSSESQTRYVA